MTKRTLLVTLEVVLTDLSDAELEQVQCSRDDGLADVASIDGQTVAQLIASSLTDDEVQDAVFGGSETIVKIDSCVLSSATWGDN